MHTVRKWVRKAFIMLGRLEQFIADILYERVSGPKTWPITVPLYLLSLVFGWIVRLRILCYKHKIFRSQPLGCFVVVVGNLTVGGTGKTPVVEQFARILSQRGRKVAILTRGYKSKAEPLRKVFWRWLTHTPPPPPKIVSDGKQVLLDSEVAGDEPYMLAKNLPGVVVLADKDRVRAGYYAIKHFGVDTLVLDDGFQYLPLRGRLDVLLIDASNPFGNTQLLPRGILREPIEHIRRAACVFLTKSNGNTQALRDTISHYKPSLHIVECRHTPKYLQQVHGTERETLAILQNAKIAALSAIAMPDGFESFLRDSGAELVYVRRFLDHHRFSVEELDHFFEHAKKCGAQFAVTTEKDAVRIPDTYQPLIPLKFLRLEIATLEGPKIDEVVTRICEKKHLI